VSRRSARLSRRLNGHTEIGAIALDFMGAAQRWQLFLSHDIE
jgi:hypothetical protein